MYMRYIDVARLIKTTPYKLKHALKSPRVNENDPRDLAKYLVSLDTANENDIDVLTSQ